MARTFNYQRATVEDIALHILTVQRQSYTKTLKYYTDREDTEIVLKLVEADRINRRKKLVAMLEAV